MLQEKYDFMLLLKEFACLMEIVSGNQLLAGLLESKDRMDGRRVIIRLSRDEAEQIMDFLIIQVAERGFDENYSTNDKGKLLEELIDRFHLRASG